MDGTGEIKQKIIKSFYFCFILKSCISASAKMHLALTTSFLGRFYSNSIFSCCQPGQPVTLWEFRRRVSIPILCPGKRCCRVNLVRITCVLADESENTIAMWDKSDGQDVGFGGWVGSWVFLGHMQDSSDA